MLPDLTVEQMEAVFEHKKRPNWLLRTLIAVSIGIHLVVFIPIADRYQSRAVSYIELTLKEISKPSSRSIPRPRHVHARPCMTGEPQTIKVRKTVIPPLKPIKLDAVKKATDYFLAQPVPLPELSTLDAPRIQHWVPERKVDNARKTAVQNPSPRVSNTDNDYVNPAAYFNMVRLRIERHKRYPEVARKRQSEGRVTIRFVIGKDGRLISVRVMKSAGKRILDQAALNAVKESSPFQRPPANLFKGSVPLQITIAFELT